MKDEEGFDREIISDVQGERTRLKAELLRSESLAAEAAKRSSEVASLVSDIKEAYQERQEAKNDLNSLRLKMSQMDSDYQKEIGRLKGMILFPHEDCDRQAAEAVAKEAARWREALHAAETALIVSSPERTDCVLAKIRALLAPAPASAPCDCEAQTERYSCAKSFGHAHCPKHCGLCAPASETEGKR